MARLVFGIVAALLLMSARLVAGQESIAAARDLYASAAYEDALAMLNRLPDSNRPADEVNSIEQYRAFCLLALGRTAEAEHAIELVVAAEPGYRPANDLSPRVRNAFTEVRRRVLPSIIQQRYMQAKTAFDKKEYATAANGFSYVLDAMNDPDVAPQAGQPPLSDIRTLAVGFKDLSVTAAAPPPPPPAPMTAAPVQPPPAPKPPRIYTSNDAEVTAPAVVRQELPPFPGQVVIPRQGMIEIVIDETGAVESAMMRISVSAAYDQLALSTAKTWRYRPATLNGVPVKYRKAVQVTIKPIGPPR
ncbi:MAG TPA: energy transducer TonB [Vicinamibacterales bacterium]|jgi:TonB family protein